MVQESSSKFSNSDQIDTPQFSKNYIAIPYVKGTSERLRSILNEYNFDVLYTIPKQFDSIIKKGKDKIEANKLTEVVYKIDCCNCEVSYIGQTKRHIATRIKEHQSDIKKHIDNPSVVSRHRMELNHEFNWSEIKILHRERDTIKKESSLKCFLSKRLQTLLIYRMIRKKCRPHMTE